MGPETADQTHIRIEDVSKSFGLTRALQKVSLEIPRGSFTTFLGPSGCGKTTLLRTIAGFCTAEAGSISIGGRRIDDVPSHLRGAVMVFQDYALFPHLSAAENIAYGLRVARRPAAEIAARLSRIASYLSIEGLLAQTPSQLSGGQQQRVALARALVMEPEVLLLDEPLSNLDARLRVSIRAELRRIQKSLGITTIYVTHDQTEALSMSDQVVVMNKGGIIQVGSPREIYFAPRTPFVASFVGMANLFEARVVSLSGRSVILDANGLRISARPWSPDIAPGTAVVLSVRPEHISLSIGSETGGSTINGTVVASLFEGSYVRYWVEAAGKEIVVDDPHAKEELSVHARVVLGFSEDRVHAMVPEKQPILNPSLIQN
jgi:ABC-type Fe3+/spermidine/putrescine transport system ATPase subunit